MTMKKNVFVSLFTALTLLAVSCMHGVGYDGDAAPTPGGDQPGSDPTSSFTIGSDAVSALYTTGLLQFEAKGASEVAYLLQPASAAAASVRANLSGAAQIVASGKRVQVEEDGTAVIPVSAQDEGGQLHCVAIYGDNDYSEVQSVTFAYAVAEVSTKKLEVRLSQQTIRGDGVDAARIYVLLDGRKILPFEKVKFYENKTNKLLDLPSADYTATEPGTFVFWVAYGANSTMREPTTIRVIEADAPQQTEDPDPSNTSFVRRAMIVQYTGTQCGYCPFMTAALIDVLADPNYADKAVLAACRTYGNDPFRPSEPLESGLNITPSGYPTVSFDMRSSFGNYGYENNVSNIKKQIDKSLSTPAQAGISANMKYSGNLLTINMSIKAAQDNTFRVGAWILEDGLSAKQANNGMRGDYDFSIHNNAIRKADSQYAETKNYTGHEIGRLSKGQRAEYLFSIELDTEKWKLENCHVLLFVTAPSDNGSIYCVVNAVDLPLKTQVVPFEYIK